MAGEVGRGPLARPPVGRAAGRWAPRERFHFHLACDLGNFREATAVCCRGAHSCDAAHGGSGSARPHRLGTPRKRDGGAHRRAAGEHGGHRRAAGQHQSRGRAAGTGGRRRVAGRRCQTARRAGQRPDTRPREGVWMAGAHGQPRLHRGAHGADRRARACRLRQLHGQHAKAVRLPAQCGRPEGGYPSERIGGQHARGRRRSARLHAP